MNQIIIQAIGYMAVLSAILSFQKSKRSKILFYLIFAYVLFTLHFILLHAWIGAAMNALAALRTIFCYQKNTKGWAQHPVWMYVFMGAFLVVGLVTWTNYSSGFAIIAAVTDTFAVWQSSAKSIRFFFLIPRPFWFAYDVFAGSYAGMTAEVIVFTSVLIGILRFDILNKKIKSAPENV